MLLRLTPLEHFTNPFPYFTAAEGFGVSVSAAILSWLESETHWILVETNFYEQYEFSLAAVSPPEHLKFLVQTPFLDDLRMKVGKIFGVRLSERVDCTVHKLIPGQRIRIHNDLIPGGETHRVLVQLNREWHEARGGYLMLFNSSNPSEVHRIIAPVHDSVVGFAISEDSNHAVSMANTADRFTLVFSFYGKSDA